MPCAIWGDERHDQRAADPRRPQRGKEASGPGATVNDRRRLLDAGRDRRRQRRDQRRGGDEAHRVGDHDHAQMARRQQQAPERAADEAPDAVVERDQRVAGYKLLGVQQGRQQRVLGRVKERRERRLDEDHPVHDHEPRVVVDEQQRQQRHRLQDRHHEHHAATIGPVREPPRERRQDDPRRELGEERARRPERRAGQAVDDDRQGDQQHPVAGVRQQSGEPDRAKVPLSECGRQPHRSSVRGNA